MIRSVSRAFLVAVTLAALIAGCGNPTAPTVTTTTTTTTSSTSTSATVAKSLTYTGTLVAGARDTGSPLIVATPGTITVTLLELPTTLLPAIGLGLGIWDTATSTCTIVIPTTAAQQGTVLTGTATIAATFCVQIWDVNGFAPGYTQPYKITVGYTGLSS